MCIYYQKDGLTYNAQEHIFPAALGGRTMLDRGVVSDQFNNDISKIEQHFVRKGMISTARITMGPGKRGSLGPGRVTKSAIQLIKGKDDAVGFGLGYTSLGVPKDIPTLSLNMTTGKLGFSCAPMPEDELTQLKLDFKRRIEDPEGLRIKWVSENRLPTDLILIGLADDIEERFNCFYFHHSDNHLPAKAETIAVIGKLAEFGDVPEKSTYMPHVMDTVEHEEDHIRIYGKIAINFLAMIKGSKFVNRPEFHDVKEWIAHGKPYPNKHADATSYNPLPSMGIEMPKDAHYIIIVRQGQELYAKVFLYGGFSIEILLAKGDFTDISTDGFICDWRNQKEYRLHQFITNALDINRLK